MCVDDSCLEDEHGDSPSRGLVAAWVYRFASIFTGPKATESLHVTGMHGIRELAYRVKPGVDWLLVLGVAPDSPVPDTAVDWTGFCIPPRD